MPHIPSAYRAKWYFKNTHISTIYFGAIKKCKAPHYIREDLELSDGDFLSIDYKKTNPQKAVVLCHGLEGSSTSNYNNLSAAYFLAHDFSVVAWNNRSCGGTMNRLPKLYHHGDSDDLAEVVKWTVDQGFSEIYLLGFSMGGAQIINYLGNKKIPKEVKSAGAVSTPIQLKSSAEMMKNGFKKVYLNRFIKQIRQKVVQKSTIFPAQINRASALKINSFEDLAQEFIVPIYRFQNLADFYAKASPGTAMQNIKTPVLLLNALNDPMIGPESFPVKEAEKHPYLYTEFPQYGGHCAFPIPFTKYSYAEIRALEFFKGIRGS